MGGDGVQLMWCNMEQTRHKAWEGEVLLTESCI
jgi:hypothetical protein